MAVAGTSPSTLGQFSDLVSEDIQKIFEQRREEMEGGMGMPKIFNVADSKSYYNKDSSVVGADTAEYIGDNASVVYDGLVQGLMSSPC